MVENTPVCSLGRMTVIGWVSPSRSPTATAVSRLATDRSGSRDDCGTSLCSCAHGTTPWLCGSDSSSVEVGLDRAPWSSLQNEVPAPAATFWACAPQIPVQGRPDTTSISSPTPMNVPVQA